MKSGKGILVGICLALFAAQGQADSQKGLPREVVPSLIEATIIRLEDERNLNGDELTGLLKHRSEAVRERAALAIGRIGDKRGTGALIALLEHDESEPVRAMAAFALGEMEDAQAVSTLMAVVERGSESLTLRGRAAEALGKIAGIQSNADALGKPAIEQINQSLMAQLPTPGAALSAGQNLLASLTITALMRVRSAASVGPLAKQLKSNDAEIRAQAANALARLRQPITDAVPTLIETLNDSDANVRANAARSLGASKDERAFGPLVKLLNDGSEQAQANAIRALASLNDKRATEALLAAGNRLHKQFLGSNQDFPPQINLLLEIATALGVIKDEKALLFLKQLRRLPLAQYQTRKRTPLVPLIEMETAIARFGEAAFFDLENSAQSVLIGTPWLNAGSIRGLGDVGTRQARDTLLNVVNKKDRDTPDDYRERLMPVVLQALARCKYDKLPELLRQQLSHRDVIVRATAANLLGDQQSDQNLSALIEALKQSRNDVENDAKLAILSSVSKYKNDRAIEALKSALDDRDHLVRRRAVELLNQTGAGDFSSRIGVVQTNHDQAFYQLVARRLDKKVTATIHTDKGRIIIELLAMDAPITVDNFVTLARQGFFNGVIFHRVVPNFVIQGGDPRGDGEGGPGHQIRCEINPRPYRRGAVGIALSGKDTGGSQFFITHSPQPHLDGGYTVFGQVASGMDVVDRIVRGDLIKRVEILESRQQGATQ